MTPIDQLEQQRRTLGMSRSALARRSGLSLPTVNRILSGHNSTASFMNVTALAKALGMELTVGPVMRPEEFLKQRARSKAQELVRLVQGTSALEGQALDAPVIEKMIRRTSSELLSSKRKLWGD